ncbi:transposable element gene, partial [Prunus dulcis]
MDKLKMSAEALQVAKVYRHLLRAVKKHVAKEDRARHFKEYVTEEFRNNCKLSDPSSIQQKIKLAHNYTFLLNSVHHHQDLLFSYNIAVDRSDEMKKYLENLLQVLVFNFLSSKTELHYQAAKRVLRYLKGTVDYGLFYKKGESNEFVGFSDSDYAGDLEDRKSTSGHVFMLSSGAVTWSSKKQQVVTLSTTEAEFIAAASCACQAVWLRRILEELHCIQKKPTLIYCDNSSTIKLSKNPVLHGRSKHMDVRFHFLRDLTKAGVVDLVHCQSQDQIADILTKPLKLEAFEKLRGLLGVWSVNLPLLIIPICQET